MPLEIDIITIFPRMLDGVLGESMMKRAAVAGAVTFRAIDLRDFTTDRHKTVDDRPYGGGPGMVMKPEPLFKAVRSVRRPESRVILMSPCGTPFKQSIARDLSAQQHLIFISGHYEGVDERFIEECVTDEICIGDYILTNGLLAAAVVIDAVVRLLPGVLGNDESSGQESFSDGLLEYPQYTRPPDFHGRKIPEILTSGNHAEIAAWRREQSIKRTRERRPDLPGAGT